MLNFGKIDLHMHSDFSDGSCSVEEIFRIAKKAKFSFIAVTDHDTAEHWDEVSKFSELRKIPCILGTEFSSIYQGREIHILGYDYDKNHPAIANILNEYKQSNINWIINSIIHFAAKTGQTVDFSSFDFKGSPDKVRITRYLLEQGFIDLNLYESFSKLVNATFKQGGQYHVKRKIKRRRYDEIIKAIKDAGGISIIAHPQKNKLEHDDIFTLKEAGLNGVEVYNRKGLQDEQKYISIAKELNLMMTGGSDFHGSGAIGIDYNGDYLKLFLSEFHRETP